MGDNHKLDASSTFGGVTLAVSDLEGSMKFYRDVLGFKVTIDPSGFRAVVQTEKEGAQLALFQVGVFGRSGPGQTERDTKATVSQFRPVSIDPEMMKRARENSKNLVVPPMPFHLEFKAKNMDELYKQVTSMGHEISEPKIGMGRGRFSFMKDPDGYTLQFHG